MPGKSSSGHVIALKGRTVRKETLSGALLLVEFAPRAANHCDGNRCDGEGIRCGVGGKLSETSSSPRVSMTKLRVSAAADSHSASWSAALLSRRRHKRFTGRRQPSSASTRLVSPPRAGSGVESPGLFAFFSIDSTL